MGPVGLCQSDPVAVNPALLVYQYERHASDQLIKVIRHVGTEEGHQPGLVTAQVIVARGNHVANIVAVEAGDDSAASTGPQEILDSQRQLAAEVTWGRDPYRIVEAKHLQKAVAFRRHEPSRQPGPKADAVAQAHVERRHRNVEANHAEGDRIRQQGLGQSFHEHPRQGLPHLLGASQTPYWRNRRLAADSAGEKHRHAAGRLLDRSLPIPWVIGAEFHHVAAEHGRVSPVHTQHGNLASVLLHYGIAEFRIDLPQPAYQTVADELRRREAALPELRRLEITQGVARRRHNAIGKPNPRLRLKATGKSFRHFALAPGTQARMRMGRTQVNLLP